MASLGMNRIKYCALILIIALLFGACGLQNLPPNPGPDYSTPVRDEKQQDATLTPTVTDDREGQEPDASGQRIRDIMDSMTLEEKVGQMLFLAYRKDMNGQNALEMDETLRDMISRYSPGGFVLFSENLDTIGQTVDFINDLQEASRIPLFISVDEEGGIVSRLNKAPALHSTVMPDAFAIGLTNDPEYAYKAARAIAEELLSLGFNMNFAPVADIFSNPLNKVIGRRAYGTEPKIVSSMVASAVKGYLDRNIIPVLKHFPGHGDTSEDTHTGAARVDHDLERLISFELLPFMEGIKSGAGAVMVAHVLLPKLMEEPVPATMSTEVVTELLRERLGFDGVVITDALEMSAVSSYYSDEEAAVAAVHAGVDMLLMPGSVEKAYGALLSAVENGIVTEERIDQSVYRILLLKEKCGILDGTIQRPDPEATLGSSEHQSIAREIMKMTDN